MERLAWHFDFHSHHSIRIGHDPDTAGMAAELAKAGVEEIITFAKCHTGFAYYPTAVGTPHPRMVGDCFGDVVSACRGEGIDVLAYISFGIDGEAGRRHSEWAQVADPDRGPRITDDHFVAVCPYTPYIDEFMLPMIQEILDQYSVNGFFFDTMGAMGICHCFCCQRDYREAFGRDIPRGPDDPDWGCYGAFRRERAWRVVGRVGQFITDQAPGMKVGFNWVGTSRFPERMPEGVTCLTCDYSTTGPQSLQASFHAAYGKTSDRPCDVMYTIINRGWGDWAPRPLPGLEQTGAAIWAHGCRPYLGDRLHPTNRLDPMSIRAIRFMGDVQRRLLPHAPAESARQLSDILMVIGPSSQYGADMAKFAADRSGIVPVEGMHHLLLDAGHSCAIAAEDVLEEALSPASLAVLSEVDVIDPVTADRLRRFVEGGGQLLVTGCVPRAADSPLDWLGIERAAVPWQDHIYLPLFDDSDDRSPVLVHGLYHKVTVTDAEVVLEAIQPYDCSVGMRFGHATGPMSFETSGVPALTRRALGQGAVWYLEAPVGSDYQRVSNYWQAEWMRMLLETLLPVPTARVVTPGGNVEPVSYVDDHETCVFLINHGGEQINPNSKTARTFAYLPPYPVVLEVARPAGRRARQVTINGEAASFEEGSDRSVVQVPVTMDASWRVVKVGWE